ncbi:MAG TPA: acyltransferase [Bryobacteraceae bacterium]|nr:acyltransferase [Bryobacteraceae bacterium]
MLTDPKLPALDGVRALAISFVLIGHCMMANSLLRNYGTLVGEAGVSVFFVLSGFLVTRVMLLDEARTGRLRLGRFYLRRALRIFPAFYTLLALLAISVTVNFLPNPGNQTWWASGLYFRNFVGAGWDTGHLWSLSLEEQFYLLWPIAFFLLRTRQNRLLLIGVAVVASIVWRAYWLAAVPSPPSAAAIQAIHCWPQMRLDTFLIGAAFAIGDWNWPRTLLPRFILPFLGIWHENAPFHGWTLPVETVVTSFAIGALILWLVKTPDLRPAHHLSRPGVVYVGVLSYSIYLWQQIFLGPHLHWWSPGAIAGCALASYYLVERPALRWKERLDQRWPQSLRPRQIGLFQDDHRPAERREPAGKGYCHDRTRGQA